VSTKEQNVESQRLQIAQWLERNHVDVPDENWYMDEGYSGATLNRPAFKALQRAVFDGKICCVVMYSLDRFARTMIDGLVEVDRWIQLRVTLVFVADALTVDSSNWMGEAILKCMIAMKLAFAEAERERMRVRQQAGIKLAEQNHSKALELSKKGASVGTIAHILKKRPETVTRMLAAQKGKRYWGGSKPGHAMKKRASHRRVKELLARGLTPLEIAKILGVGERTIYRRIKDLLSRSESPRTT